MRSISASGRFCQEAPPVDCESIRTPSIYTAVKRDSAPRMNTLVVVPGPPLRVISIPGTLASTSATPPKPCLAMVSASIMLISAVKSDNGCAMRLAVTTISGKSFALESAAATSCWDCADTLAANNAAAKAMLLIDTDWQEAATANSGARRRTKGMWEYIDISNDEYPEPASPPANGEKRKPHTLRAQQSTMLAGIRANDVTARAFPNTCSRYSVAKIAAADGVKCHPSLTVAGAAQVETVLIDSRKLPCFPLNC